MPGGEKGVVWDKCAVSWWQVQAGCAGLHSPLSPLSQLPSWDQVRGLPSSTSCLQPRWRNHSACPRAGAPRHGRAAADTCCLPLPSEQEPTGAPSSSSGTRCGHRPNTWLWIAFPLVWLLYVNQNSQHTTFSVKTLWKCQATSMLWEKFGSTEKKNTNAVKKQSGLNLKLQLKKVICKHCRSAEQFKDIISSSSPHSISVEKHISFQCAACYYHHL